METITSRIKTMFQPELLRFIAAICDTRRIESNNEKMIVLCDLLYTHDIKFEILGGATNRIALQIDGYAVKFAMDEQGYLDNLIEYSLSPELQPYVTKSYETNGYIQVQECVEVMTKDSFKIHRVEINKVLDSLCQDYLLGDVGYIDKNRTNWGIRNGKPVILDYAYCHRATENLFTCSKCGAPLRYDSTYDKLMCSDRSACKTVYTYNERKRIQGKKVDEDMVKERKAQSICLPGDTISKEIEMFEDRLVGDNYFIIDSPGDMYRYNELKEAINMKVTINGGEDMTTLEERFAAMVELAKNPNDAKAKEIMEADVDDDLPEAIYTDRYQERYMYGSSNGIRMYNLHNNSEDEEESTGNNYEDDEDYGDTDFDSSNALADMINQMRADQQREVDEFKNRSNQQMADYLSKFNEKNAQESEEPHETISDEPANTTDEEVADDVEALLKGVHEPSDADTVNVDTDESTGDDDSSNLNPEDVAVLVNGKPLPIGEEVVL